MDSGTMKELLVSVLGFSVVVSCVSAGIKKTIKVIMNKADDDKLNKWIGLGLVYGFGILGGFLLKNEYIVAIWEKIVYGVFIGSITVLLYESAIKHVKNLIPSVFGKLKLDKKDPPSNKEF